jgi:ribosomal-protein-serine acetyltransferase
MFSFIVDEDLRLVLPQPHMAEELAAVVRENLERLKVWMPWAVEDYSVEMANDFIKRSLNGFAENGQVEALILWKYRVIGAIGFHHLDLINRTTYIGYWVAEGYEGKGIITRSCRALVSYLFETLELNRVQINCNTDNIRSRAVPERLGFKLEGIHREIEYLNGRYGDWAVYAVLRKEWNVGN